MYNNIQRHWKQYGEEYTQRNMCGNSKKEEKKISIGPRSDYSIQILI